LKKDSEPSNATINYDIYSSHEIPSFKLEIGAIMEIVILIDWMKDVPEDLHQKEPFFRNLFLNYKKDFKEANPGREDLEELARRLMKNLK
jgi:hypothetical protein